MHPGPSRRSPIVAIFMAVLLTAGALPTLAAEPQPVLPVGSVLPPVYDPSQPYDPDQSGARCPAGTTRMSASGELILSHLTGGSSTSYPAPVLPVPSVVTVPPPGCLTDLALSLIVKSPDDRKPEGADASLDAIAVPRSALESGFDVSLPAQDRLITLSDPGPDWKIIQTSCSCGGWTGLSATIGGGQASSFGQPSRLATYPQPVIPIAPGGPGNCSGSRGAAQTATSGARMSVGAFQPREATAYPGPVLPLNPRNVYRRAPVISWDASGTVSLRDPDGVGGTFSCVWTVEMTNGRLAVKTITKPAGREGKFEYLATPTGPQAADASAQTLPGTRTPAQASLKSGPWSVELSNLTREWKVTSSDCSESDGTTPSIAQGAAAAAGVDPGDSIACTFKLKLLAPKPGRWNARNGASRISCDSFAIKLPAVSDAGSIKVRDDGDLLIARGLSQGGSTWKLRRDPDDPLHYTGAVRLSVQGASGTFNLDLEMVNEKRLVGTFSGKAKVRGVTCAFNRSLKLSHAGGK